MTVVRTAFRFLLVLGLSLTVLAVGVARLAPSRDGSSAQLVRPSRVHYEGVNDHAGLGPEQGCRLLDADSARIVSMKLPGNEMLLFARSSPWEGPDGQVQVVGRWVSRDADPRRTGIREVGLARCTFPAGEVLDRIAVDVVPLSAPCWFPGPLPRILYGGTNGQLYRLAFDGPGAGEGDSERQLRPTPVRWACKKPGQGEVRISDPTWPTDPRLKGRLLASITYMDRVGDGVAFVPSQLWWLELSSDGGAIEAAGRLSADRHRTPSSAHERFPSLARTPDGGLVLAYLSRPAGRVGWELRLAPISIDRRTGDPRLHSRAGVPLARDVAVASPSFSSDGRWVLGLHSTSRSAVEVERFSVVEALAAHRQRQLAWRAHHPNALRPQRGERLRGKS